MTDRVAGKVAFITGAARGQGRSHAVRLAEEGASIIAVDICADVPTVSYPMGTSEELDETVELVEKVGGKIVARKADVRDQSALDEAVAAGIEAFGAIDVVSANAGIASFGRSWEMEEATWQDMIDIALTGVWHTAKAVLPGMVAAGRGGSVIITSSAGGLKGIANSAAYVAAKHGVIGLMKTIANEVAPYGIRVNALCPGSVNTLMASNQSTLNLFRPDLEKPTIEDVDPVLRQINALPIRWLETEDIANALLWLASEEARYVTGTVIPVDAGWVIK
jgi:SDR family mycofactocin-dependent oxidoreductase